MNFLEPRKIFEVIIDKNTYDVYDINGKEHAGLHDEPKTWWLYYSKQLPEGAIPPIDSEDWKPWSKGINRMLWDIRFKETNTTKEKWNETRFSHHLNCEMYCNEKLVYSFGTFDLDFAFAKARYLITMMSEHPFDFFNPESENGRKIYFHNLPAIVKVSSHESWEIRIKPDYSEMTKQEWWSEYKKRTFRPDEDFPDWDKYEEGESDDSINWGDALSDGNINWFRK